MRDRREVRFLGRAGRASQLRTQCPGALQPGLGVFCLGFPACKMGTRRISASWDYF